MDYSTPEKQERRMAELVKGYKESGNRPAIVRLIGGSMNDHIDYTEADAGEPPKNAQWN